jgi:hypothetical protein
MIISITILIVSALGVTETHIFVPSHFCAPAENTGRKKQCIKTTAKLIKLTYLLRNPHVAPSSEQTLRRAEKVCLSRKHHVRRARRDGRQEAFAGRCSEG